jgi:hypothetical protein
MNLRRLLQTLRRPAPEPEPEGSHFFDLARFEAPVGWDPSQPPPPGTPDHVLEAMGRWRISP